MKNKIVGFVLFLCCAFVADVCGNDCCTDCDKTGCKTSQQLVNLYTQDFDKIKKLNIEADKILAQLKVMNATYHAVLKRKSGPFYFYAANYSQLAWGMAGTEVKLVAQATASAYKVKWPGLVNKTGTVSFESVSKPGFYLRHQNYWFHLHAFEDTQLYKEDASFRPKPNKFHPGYTAYQSYNLPTNYIRHESMRLKISPDDNSVAFRSSSSFEEYPTPSDVTACGWGVANRAIIPDTSFNQSSFWKNNDEPKYSGYNARLNAQTYWHRGHADKKPWVQVDLGSVGKVTGITTQGRTNNIADWVTKYKIQYGDNVNNLKVLTSNGNEKIFDGNTDRTTPITRMFKVPIIARYVRIVCIEWNRQAVLRIELLKC